MRSNNKIQHGFTLIELMIVVAIIGILAAVAVPAFSYFITKSKTSDGRDKLSMIAQGAIAYYNAEHFYDGTGLNKTAHLYPGCQDEYKNYSVCSHVAIKAPAKGQKKPPAANSFNSQPWPRLNFLVDAPIYYGFVYHSNAISNQTNTFTACAVGNLSKSNDSQFIIAGEKDGRLSSMREHEGQTLQTECTNGI